jgi:hypothetical protein
MQWHWYHSLLYADNLSQSPTRSCSEFHVHGDEHDAGGDHVDVEDAVDKEWQLFH